MRRPIRKPKLKRQKLANLRVPGVYVLYRDGTPVYVGQSQDVQQRIRDHAWPTSGNKHAYRDGFDEYAIINKSSVEDRLALEKYLIALYRPAGNKQEWPARADFLRILSDPFFAPAVHRAANELEAENADK